MVIGYNKAICTNNNTGTGCPLLRYIPTAVASSKKLAKNIIIKKIAERIGGALRTRQIITYLLGIGFSFYMHYCG